MKRIDSFFPQDSIIARSLKNTSFGNAFYVRVLISDDLYLGVEAHIGTLVKREL